MRLDVVMRICALIGCFIGLGRTSVWAACPDEHVKFYYINGINTESAKPGSHALAGYLNRLLGGDVKCDVAVYPLTNSTAKQIGDLCEAAYQKHLVNATGDCIDAVYRTTSPFWLKATIDFALHVVDSFAKESAIDPATVRSKYKDDFDAMYDRLESDLKADAESALIVVAHSQGNLFANELLSRLVAKRGPTVLARVGLVSVATPASDVVAGSQQSAHTTLIEDFIWRPEFIPDALAWNVVDVPKGYCAVNDSLIKAVRDVKGMIQCHNFIDTYLFSKDSQKRILDKIRLAEASKSYLKGVSSTPIYSRLQNQKLTVNLTRPVPFGATDTTVLMVSPDASIKRLGRTAVTVSDTSIDMDVNLTEPGEYAIQLIDAGGVRSNVILFPVYDSNSGTVVVNASLNGAMVPLGTPLAYSVTPTTLPPEPLAKHILMSGTVVPQTEFGLYPGTYKVTISGPTSGILANASAAEIDPQAVKPGETTTFIIHFSTHTANTAPRASFSIGVPPVTVESLNIVAEAVSGSALVTFTDTSTDPDGHLVSRRWTTNTGCTPTDPLPCLIAENPAGNTFTWGFKPGGPYVITLSVIDDGTPPVTATATATINVAAPPLTATAMIDLGTLGGTYSSASAVNNHGMVVGDSTTVGDAEDHAFAWTKTGGMLDLGTLGGTYSYATAVNDFGMVVGVSGIANDVAAHAFAWTAESGMLDLGTLGGVNSLARAVNNHGTVVGRADRPEQFTEGIFVAYDAFVWTAATGMVDIGTLGGFSSDAIGVNDDGMVIGRSLAGHGSNPSSDVDHGFAWTQTGGMLDLGTLGGAVTEPTALSATGQAVGFGGTTVDCELIFHGCPHDAFTWTQTNGLVDLGTLSGTASEAYAININGVVVGLNGSRTSGGGHAIAWTADGITDMGTLGGSRSYAVAINDRNVAVGSSETSAGTDHAFAWVSTDGMIDLGTLGGRSSEAVAINNDGVAVGSSWTANDAAQHAVVWIVSGQQSNVPPVVRFAISDSSQVVLNDTAFTTVTDRSTGEARVTFSDRSIDPDGATDIVSRIWLTDTGVLLSDGLSTFTWGFRPGTYKVVLTVTDRGNHTVTATAIVQVFDAPNTAHDDRYVMTRGTTLTVNAPGVLANDNPLSMRFNSVSTTFLSIPAGAFQDLSDGAYGPSSGGFSYTPDPHFVGTTSFIYAVATNTGASNTATVTIDVLNNPTLSPVASGRVCCQKIAISGSGRIHVVWNDGVTSQHSYSDDGGHTFSEPRRPPIPSGGMVANITATSGGALYMVSVATGVGGESDVFLTRSLDDGATFITDGVGVASSNMSHDLAGSIRPRIVASGSTVYAVWEVWNHPVGVEPTQQVAFVRSSDFGATFGAPIELFGGAGLGPTGIAEPLDMAISSAGTIAVAYNAVLPSRAASQIVVTRSSDGGASFSDPVAVDNRGEQSTAAPSIAIDSGHTIHVAWHSGPFSSNGNHAINYAEIKEDLTLSATETILPNAPIAAKPVMVVDHSNQVRIAWSNFPLEGIQIAESPDVALTTNAFFAAPQGSWALDPAAVVGIDGRLWLAWSEAEGSIKQVVVASRP
jgi:probable HAF family extracellular repeat protein